MNDISPYSFKSTVHFIKNNFLLFVVAGLFLTGGFIFGSLWTEKKMLNSGTSGSVPAKVAGAPTQQVAPQPAGDPPKLTNNEHVRGNKNAKVTLIEYSDFECPFCARFHPTMQQVLKEYGDKVKLVYRHYPLSFHPNAQKAAEGSECVNKLAGNDAFWKYVDALFAENEKLGGKLAPESITAAAQAAGVNQNSFKTCLDSNEFAQKVKADMDGGTAAGVSGTPGTFILAEDGTSEFINGALPYEQIKQSLDKYVK